ncbi:MAG: DUF1858 domain-containing protein, partial [Nitrospinaceae bacterium]|nr:DUF1858 domain-containing protein [Nitrospinaceae bacterium]NIY18439.1 DUF1858 domain-containing protein [Nitrospinaceae bacterium]
LLGWAMGISPILGNRIRFVHVHFNLLGFLAMMVTGVAYHVLPRFNARPVPWPGGVGVQFYLQNLGLLGMAGTYLLGAPWQGGLPHGFFLLFSGMAGVALFIMFYNLYFVLTPASTAETPDRITRDMKVSAVLDRFPQAMPVFLQSGFSALTNPAARRTFAKVVSIEKACQKHGVNVEEFLRRLNAELFEKPGAGDSAKSPAAPPEQAPVGKPIQAGELCDPKTMVGSLIKVYPETKPVFEKHYGEGCFSCPGQIYETVEQTAVMHGKDPRVLLDDINAVIRARQEKEKGGPGGT